MLMEIVFEEIAAKMASVPIVNRKELRFDSLLLDVESDANSVLIVVSHNSLVGVHSIAFDGSVLLARGLCWLERRHRFLYTLAPTLHNGCQIHFLLVLAGLGQVLAFQGNRLDFILAVFAYSAEQHSRGRVFLKFLLSFVASETGNILERGGSVRGVEE